jgi:hypothetical protein
LILLASGYGVWCGWQESLVASAVIAALLSLATLVIFLSQLM